MRGAVSLAAALALPADFPQRDVVLLMTFAVIFMTSSCRGLMLPALIRRLHVHDDGTEDREECWAAAPRWTLRWPDRRAAGGRGEGVTLAVGVLIAGRDPSVADSLTVVCTRT